VIIMGVDHGFRPLLLLIDHLVGGSEVPLLEGLLGSPVAEEDVALDSLSELNQVVFLLGVGLMFLKNRDGYFISS
jgi:hypothetical protein